MHIEIKHFSSSTPEYAEALALRDEVLRKPLGMQFTEKELAKDKEDVHFGLFIDGQIAACLILSNAGDKRMKMRQVAVKADHQGKGYGKQLSDVAEEYAARKGFKTIFCH